MKQQVPSKLLIAFGLIFWLASARPVFASHSMGADLTYQCLGGNTYKITLSFYRDCIGIAAPVNPFVTIKSASCGQNLGVTCYKRAGTGQEVTPACSSTVTTCNGGTFTGIQEYIYDGIFTLPMQCTDWIFGYSLCCRNAAITNISSPSSSTFYIYATLNNVITPCNSSPTFSNKPVPFICLGQQYCFNHGAYDVDGDSLAYTLITPKQTATTDVNYIAPYNAANPLNSSPATTFNPTTGDICLTPQAMEVTVMAVLVSEYRNGVLIGSVERDLQLTVMNCNNNLPNLTGINGTNNFSITFCANQMNCFDIFSNDVDTGQTLSVTWDYGIPGATLTSTSALHPVSTFCWTPSTSDIGRTFHFTVLVHDNACPYYGSQIYSYTVTVIGITANAGPDQNIACSDLATLTASASGGSGTYTYLWNTGSTMQSITVGAGTYWVTANDGTCSATDTVVVNMPFIPNAAFLYTPVNCVNNPIQFTDQSTTPAGVIMGWDWDFGDGSTSTLQNPVYQYSSPGTYNATLIIYNSLGCYDTIVHQIDINPKPITKFSYSNSCVNTVVSFTDQTLPAATTWQWTFGDGAVSAVQNPTHLYTVPGTYVVTLVSGGVTGCTDSISHTITIFPRPVANAGADQSLCSGGSVTLTATGGGSYNWIPGGSTLSSIVVNPATTTNYVVLVTDTNGCSSSDTVTAIVNPVVNISAGPDKVMCFGNTALLSASGGTSYVWMPGGNTTPSITVGPAVTTTYVVTGTDLSGCNNTDTITVAVQPLPIADAGPDVSICSGSSVTLNASGGSSYSWIPTGGTNQSITVSPTTYTIYGVFVTDTMGCSSVAFVNVYVQTLPVVHLQSLFICAGDLATLDAGVSGYLYNWTPTGATTQTIQVSTGGTYTVTVSDITGCSATSSATIAEGISLNINLGNFRFCQGDSVLLDAGHPGMNYEWNPTGEMTQTIYTTLAGAFSVMVIDTLGCSGTISMTTSVDPLPSPNFNATSPCLNNATIFTDASTIGTGSIATYAWNFGDGVTSLQQNPTHTYSSAGSYNVSLTTTSANGCSKIITKTVIVNPLPVTNFAYTNSCQGNTVNFMDLSTVTTGNIVTYSWNFGDLTTSSLKNPSHVYTTPGNYNVTLQVVTAGGCTGTISQQISIYPKPTANFTTAPVCNGAATLFVNNSSISTGSITSVFWDFNDTYTSSQTSPSHTYLAAGTYSVKLVIYSALGCMDSITRTVTVYSLPNASVGADQIICNGSTVTLTASGGSSYTWSPGGQTSSTITVSPASSLNYTVTATNSNGCTATDAVNVQVNPLPVISAGPDKNICIGATTSLVATGGNSYTWMPGNFTGNTITVQPATTVNYTVTGIDINGCQNTDIVQVNVNLLPNISAGPDQNICLGSTIALHATGGNSYIWNPIGSALPNVLITPAASSTYVLIGTDVNGCLNSDTVHVTVNPVPVVTLLPTFVCSGYSTTLDAGNPGSSYLWSTGDVTQSIMVFTPGTYSVMVTNPAGCNALSSTIVTLDGGISGSPSLDSACTGQTVTLDAGNAGSTYLWSNGSTLQTINVTSTGNYNVVITNIHGCSATILHTVNINPLPAVAFSSPSTCFGISTQFTDQTTLSSGSIQNYTWNFGDGFSSSLQNPIHNYTSTGTYTVSLTVTTAGGCNAIHTQTVQVFENPQANFNSTTACFGSATTFTDNSTITSGSITGWSWNFGDNNSAGGRNQTHTYGAVQSYLATLVVTSNHGCTDTITNNLSIHGLPTAAFTGTNVCAQSPVQFLNNSFSLNGTITGYAWSFGDGNVSNQVAPSHSYSSEGNYTVELMVTSSLGCTDTATSTVTIHPLPDANFNVTPGCAGTQIAIVNHSTVVSGSITNLHWDFGDNSTSGSSSPSHIYVQDGNYNVTLITTTNFGCNDTAIRTVNVYPLPVASFSALDVCAGTEVEFFDSTSLSSGSIATWSWLFGDQSSSNISGPVHIYQNNGTFPVQLTVVSNYGCSNVYSDNINIFPNPVASFSTGNVCFGNANVFSNLSSVPGGIPFTCSWDYSDGTIDSIPDPNHIFNIPGNFNVTLTVSTASGCSQSVTQSIGVYQGPYTRFSTNDNCLGVPTQFNDNSTSVDGTIASWFWEFGDGANSTESNPLHQYNSPGRYHVMLTTTTTLGCFEGYTDSLEILQRPAASIQIQDACLGMPVQFVNSSVNPNMTGISYQWDLGNGILSTDSSFSYTYGSAGIYDVTMVASSPQGCHSRALYQVSVYPSPTAQMHGGDHCLNTAVTFHNLSSISTGYITYWNWTFGDGYNSAQAAPTYTYLTPGNYTVTLTAVSDHGCTSTTSSVVRVFPVPAANFSAGGQGCSPMNALFNDNSVSNSGTITSWLWDFGDGGFSTDQYPNHMFTQGGLYDIKLTVTNDVGCQSSMTQSGVIRVFASPVSDFTADPMVTDILEPVVHFQNTSQGFTNYQWVFGDGYFTSSELNPVHTFLDTGVYTAKLITVNSFGCRDTILKIIEVRPHSTLYVPNCFTPNGDGKNDLFRPYYTQMATLHVWIFDRWGKLLTDWEGLNGSWDGYYQGNKCQSDVYVYKIRGEGLDGKYSEWVGHVSIVY